MPLDSDTLESLREIMFENFSDYAKIYRKVKSVASGEPASISDGMGGFVYSQANKNLSKDERTLIYENVPCRVTVPRGNRSEAEYIKNSATVSESRAVVIFPHDTDIKESDRIDVTLRNRLRSFEVQVIADHSESFSLQTVCVEIGVQRI